MKHMSSIGNNNNPFGGFVGRRSIVSHALDKSAMANVKSHALTSGVEATTPGRLLAARLALRLHFGLEDVVAVGYLSSHCDGRRAVSCEPSQSGVVAYPQDSAVPCFVWRCLRSNAIVLLSRDRNSSRTRVVSKAPFLYCDPSIFCQNDRLLFIVTCSM